MVLLTEMIILYKLVAHLVLLKAGGNLLSIGWIKCCSFLSTIKIYGYHFIGLALALLHLFQPVHQYC